MQHYLFIPLDIIRGILGDDSMPGVSEEYVTARDARAVVEALRRRASGSFPEEGYWDLRAAEALESLALAA